MGETLLKIDGLTKRFPGVVALNNAKLEILKGEVHAVAGENGAGKSTLMNIILGSIQPDEGTIEYKGKTVRFSGPNEALRNGISMIHQEISLVQSLDIAENVWLGQEGKFIRYGLLNKRARYKATEKLLNDYGITHLNPRTNVRDLSVANMQLVEIARAISNNSDLIIMDEPTSALTSVEIKILYEIIEDLTSKGVSVIFISHKLDEILSVCDRVSVFRDGTYITTKNCAEIDEKELINYIIGRDLTEMFPKMPAEIKEAVLQVSNLSVPGVFDDISFSVKAGEILGFSGLVGSGRTEIMRAIFGVDRYSKGEIVINGKKAVIRKPKDAIDYGLGMVTEDRMRLGCIYTLSVLANSTIAYFNRICNKLGFYLPSKEKAEFNAIINRISIKYSSPKEKITQLSGGNQQKVILARWLMTKPKILILDEPTRGIDVGSKAEIHRIISSLAQQGMAIILVSSELPEILGMSDRIIVVRNKKIVADIPREKADQGLLIQYAFGTQSI